MSDRELHFKSAVEIGGLIRTGRLTSVDVTKAMLSRINEIDDIYVSYLHVCGDRALERAATLDREIQLGICRGPLHGVPVAVKDLCYTDFAPTTAGTKIHAGFVPPFTSTVVTRLEAAGAVILGKLAMTEGAYTNHHPDIPYPPNPWNEDYWVGSSSTGSGVGTAAGLCFGSIGSDTGGSIRLPSATCGLTGIKPTWGRVSRHGIFALGDTLDHIGPMTRSVADAAAMLQAVSGWDANDPTSIDAPVPDYMLELEKGIRGMRIGLDRRYAFENTDGDNTSALKSAVAVFEKLGARIVDVEFPEYDEAVKHWNMLCSVETALAHRETYPKRKNEYGAGLSALIELGLSASGLEVAKGNIVRRTFTEALATMFRDVDCMLVPTLPIAIPSLEQMSSYGSDPEKLLSIIRFTAPFDLSGTPTITLPNGFDKNGLMTSMQLAGPRLSEDILIRGGHAFQRATDWHTSEPPMKASILRAEHQSREQGAPAVTNGLHA